MSLITSISTKTPPSEVSLPRPRIFHVTCINAFRNILMTKISRSIRLPSGNRTMHRPVTMSDALPVCEIFSSIQGEGYLAGRRQVFVRLTECNLDCGYCDTLYAQTETCQVESLPGSAMLDHLPQPISCRTMLDLLKNWTTQFPFAHHS